MTCVFEGSLNDAIMAQHAKNESYSQVKGKSVVYVTSVASFHSLWLLLSHSYFYERAPRIDFNFNFQTQLRINGLMLMDKYIKMCGSRGGDRGSRPNHKNIGFLSNISPDPLQNHKSLQASIQCWATIGPPAKRHLNGVSLAGH